VFAKQVVSIAFEVAITIRARALFLDHFWGFFSSLIIHMIKKYSQNFIRVTNWSKTIWERL